MRRVDRHSVRLRGYDYTSPGAYFVTMVTFRRESLFGGIVEGEMRLNGCGEIAAECWGAIPDHFPGVELGAFVVMPNHIHGIIILTGGGTIYRAPTTTERKERFGKPVAGSLPTIIRTFKAAVTRLVGRELGEQKIWQRNYYEHIIRSDREFHRVEKYILANPEKWEGDRESLSTVKEAP